MPEPARLDAFLKLDTGTHTHDIVQIVVSPDGRKLVTAGECTLRVWDAQTRRPLHVLLGQVAARSEEVFGSGNVIRMALSPRDGRSLVVLKGWSLTPGAKRRERPHTEVQVFDIETGNLRTRFLDNGCAEDLDFSADGRHLALAGPDARVRVFAARDVLQAGFRRVPAPLAQRRFLPFARGRRYACAVRFVPAPHRPGAADRLVVAVNAGPAARDEPPPAGAIAWGSFCGAAGLRCDRLLGTDGPVHPPTLAASDEWAVVGAWRTVPRGRQALGRVLGFSHDGLQQPVLYTEAPPSSTAFAPTGNRLLVGMLALGAAVPGLASVPVQAYAVSCLGFELRSTYLGHDHDVLALGFLADDGAVSAGGDSQSIHFWDCASQVGQLQAVIRGAGRTVFDARVSASQQVLFSTVPRRDAPLNRLQRQRTFCLRTLTLGATEPALVRVAPSDRGKWVVLDVTGRSQLIPIRHGPSAYGDDLDLPPDLTLFVGSDDEWVLWTRSGYYDASRLGARRMGYHVNRGADQEALFLPSDRFKAFHRPDIVAAVVRHGSEARARAAGVAIEPLDVARLLPPVIELEGGEPQPRGDELRLRFSVRPLDPANPVTRVWVLRNDRFAWTTHGPVRRTRFDLTLPLGPGRNVFSVRAENACGRAVPIEREVWGPKAAPQAPLAADAPGHLFLLAVGVSDFAVAGTPRAEQFRLRALKCAHRDAIAVYNALACSVESDTFDRRRPQRNRAFDAVHAHLLVDAAATKAAIRDTLRSLCRQIEARGRAPGAERDVLVIFLAGHGVQLAGDPNLYFLNHDMVLDDAEETGLAMLEIGEMIARVPAEVVVLVDTCHSGLAGNGIDRGVGPEEVARRLQEVSERGMYVLSAARAEEIAHEGGERGHGVFTAALLATLKSPRYLQRDAKGRGASLGMAGLMAGLQAEMPRITARLGKPAQTPVFRLFGDLLPLTIHRR